MTDKIAVLLGFAASLFLAWWSVMHIDVPVSTEAFAFWLYMNAAIVGFIGMLVYAWIILTKR